MYLILSAKDTLGEEFTGVQMCPELEFPENPPLFLLNEFNNSQMGFIKNGFSLTKTPDSFLSPYWNTNTKKYI